MVIDLDVLRDDTKHGTWLLSQLQRTDAPLPLTLAAHLSFTNVNVKIYSWLDSFLQRLDTAESYRGAVPQSLFIVSRVAQWLTATTMKTLPTTTRLRKLLIKHLIYRFCVGTMKYYFSGIPGERLSAQLKSALLACEQRCLDFANSLPGSGEREVTRTDRLFVGLSTENAKTFVMSLERTLLCVPWFECIKYGSPGYLSVPLHNDVLRDVALMESALPLSIAHLSVLEEFVYLTISWCLVFKLILNPASSEWCHLVGRLYSAGMYDNITNTSRKGNLVIDNTVASLHATVSAPSPASAPSPRHDPTPAPSEHGASSFARGPTPAAPSEHGADSLPRAPAPAAPSEHGADSPPRAPTPAAPSEHGAAPPSPAPPSEPIPDYNDWEYSALPDGGLGWRMKNKRKVDFRYDKCLSLCFVRNPKPIDLVRAQSHEMGMDPS